MGKKRGQRRELILVIFLLIFFLNLFNLYTTLTFTGLATGQVTMCINRRPTIPVIPGQSIAHNSPFVYDLNATDQENHTLSYADNTTLFEINSSTGLMNFTPNISQVGNYTILITVTEVNSWCIRATNATFSLEIYNRPPNLTAVIPNQSWGSDIWLTGVDIGSYFSDPEGDPLYYTVQHGNNVSVEISSAGIATIYPDPDWNGQSWIRFTANDTLAATHSNNVTLTVGDNTPPRIVILRPYASELTSSPTVLLKVTVSELSRIIYNPDSLGNVTLTALSSGGSTNLLLPDFGNHTLVVYAIDRYGNSNSTALNFTVQLDSDQDGTPDSQDSDSDNDGIPDTSDFFIGNTSNCNTNLPGFSIWINNSTNLSQNFSGTLPVKFSNQTHTFVEFDHLFSATNPLICGRMTFEKQSSSAQMGSFFVRGVNLSAGETKIIYVERLNGSDRVCLKDTEILSLSEISSDCDGANEYILSCPGSTSGYTCSLPSSAQYRITGLTHSGAVEMVTVGETGGTSTSTSTSAGGGGGGGGGGTYKVVETKTQILPVEKVICLNASECGEWTPKRCDTSAKQEKTCLKILPNCNIIEVREERDCQCVPQWVCTTWQPPTCLPDEEQSRTCLDANYCGMEIDVLLTQKCAITKEGKLLIGDQLAMAGRAFWSRAGEKFAIYFLPLSLLAIFSLGLIILLIWVKKQRRRHR